MAMDIWGITRTVSLWVMIVTAIVANSLLYIERQIFWATFWSIVIVLVVIYEIAALVFKKKTISTLYKDWTIKSPLTARTTLFLLWIGLNSLIIHLAVW